VRIIDRLKQDHEHFLERMEDLETRLAAAPGGAWEATLQSLADFLNDVERHERFEESALLHPLEKVSRDELVKREVADIRRTHGNILSAIRHLQRQAAALPSEPAAFRQGLGVLATQLRGTFQAMREHIRRENLGLFFLAIDHLTEQELDHAATPEQPFPC
jgi:hemerythrin-like domain-containing protein